jgi:hypothetical protein
MAKRKPSTSDPPESPDPNGGEGVAPKRDDLNRLRYERMAIAQSWPIKPEDREDTLANARSILKNKKAGSRSHIAAGKLVAMLNAQNLAAIGVALQARAQEDLVDRIERLESQEDTDAQPE